jgi:quercetin dioxygenase-like cupin family protein
MIAQGSTGASPGGATAAPYPVSATVCDLGAVPVGGGDGARWSLPHGGDLDANLVGLGPGSVIGSHRNDEVDVLVYVQSGAGELTIDDEVHSVRGGWVVLVPRGSCRSVRASNRGLVYLSIHRRRDGLQLGSRAAVRRDGAGVRSGADARTAPRGEQTS